jgi:hypothetical protein
MQMQMLLGITLQSFVPLSFLVTTSLVIVGVQPSFAFTIIPSPSNQGATENYDPEVTLKDYARANLGGVNNAIAGTNRDFITTLKQSNFARSLGWKFSSSSSNLGGTLTVSNYYACAGSTVCAPDLSGVNTGGLGAFLEVNYNRAGTDPSRSTLHWIQRIIVQWH